MDALNILRLILWIASSYYNHIYLDGLVKNSMIETERERVRARVRARVCTGRGKKRERAPKCKHSCISKGNNKFCRAYKYDKEIGFMYKIKKTLKLF